MAIFPDLQPKPGVSPVAGSERKAASLPALVLASGSPRRRELLAGLGIAFETRPVDLDESRRDGEGPRAYVRRLAEEKALARAEPGEVVIAGDTVVVIDGEVLGKPSDPEEARAMLGRISGHRHQVLTGIAVHESPGGRLASGVDSTLVRMDSLSRERIAWYVATGEPLDKAGSYAIQGLGALFVAEIEGNYGNVVGLPLPLTRRLLSELGYDLLDFRQD